MIASSWLPSDGSIGGRRGAQLATLFVKRLDWRDEEREMEVRAAIQKDGRWDKPKCDSL